MSEQDASEEDVIQQTVNDLIGLLEHPGFRVLVMRANAEKAKAIEDLCEVDPENSPEIRRLQERVARADWLVDTVDELIQQGLTREDESELEEPIEDDGTTPDNSE